MLPPVRATWAPKGKTPVLRHHFNWKRLSMATAIAYEPDATAAELVFQMRPGAYNDEALIEFLGQVHDLLRGRKVTLLWDGLPSHRSKVNAKAQVHAVMAKCGILPALDDMFGPGGQVLLDKMELPQPYRYRVDSLRRLLGVFDDEIDIAESQARKRLRGHRGYRAVQAIKGVGPVMAAIFVAEIGDVSRFASARHLCSWAGVTPSHRESDDKAHRGHITKQGSTLVRWAAVGTVARYHGGAPIAPAFRRIQERRGTMIARVAAARKLLTLVYYGLRDGEVRCLRKEAA